jgi:thiamine-phosphate pyrophosphorylase
MSNSLMRVADENLDRLAEGLRVLEDLARMLLDDQVMTSRLKALRHDLIRGDLNFNLELLQARDSSRDVGEKLEVPGDRFREISLIALANSRRAQEALRVLEDLAKLPELSSKLDSNQFKSARFALYSIEKELVGRLARQVNAALIKGLYVIVDTAYLGHRNPLEITRRLVGCGVKTIQLRSKDLTKKQLIQLADQMQKLCRQSRVLFIINDHLDVALAVGADGLHIGQDDFPVALARQLLPLGTLLGVSAATLEEAQAAETAGADYLGVGAIFPTSTKQNTRTLGIETLRQIHAAVKLPLAAIGGINSRNIAEVIEAGAASACVISAVLGAPDIEEAARSLNQIIEVKK